MSTIESFHARFQLGFADSKNLFHKRICLLTYIGAGARHAVVCAWHDDQFAAKLWHSLVFHSCAAHVLIGTMSSLSPCTCITGGSSLVTKLIGETSVILANSILSADVFGS